MSCPRNKHMFRRRSVGCFSRRERRAYLESIRKERATRKNSQLNTAQRVAMKMGRRLRCSSVTYPLRYAPSTASPARTALPAAHFDRNETYAYFGDRTLAWTIAFLVRKQIDSIATPSRVSRSYDS